MAVRSGIVVNSQIVGVAFFLELLNAKTELEAVAAKLLG
jgi:hypothetical protein